MKTKSFATLRPQVSALRSSSGQRTNLERVRSSAKFAKLPHHPEVVGFVHPSDSLPSSSQNHGLGSQYSLGAFLADRRSWLSRAFRLGRGCCRAQKTSACQNLYLRLPPALPHGGKNAAP